MNYNLERMEYVYKLILYSHFVQILALSKGKDAFKSLADEC